MSAHRIAKEGRGWDLDEERSYKPWQSGFHYNCDRKMIEMSQNLNYGFLIESLMEFLKV